MGDMMKFGVVGLDGHGLAFSKVVNGDELKIEGARVVAAVPIPSVMRTDEELAERVEEVRGLGVEICETIDEVLERCDGVLVLHDDGSKHCELAVQCMGNGKPVFVDKPFEVTAAQAKRMVAVATDTNTPIFSASSLRFSRELTACLADEEGGAIMSAMCFSPYSPMPSMPGWIYYGCHAVEPLFMALGTGCRTVRCHLTDAGPVALGTWDDGRIGIARATKGMCHGHGFTIWKETDIISARVDTQYIYPGLLAAIKEFFTTGRPPIPAQQSIESVAFMEAANASMAQDGAVVELDL